MDYKLTKVLGLQRSGNHAILNWLNGLDTENTLFLNHVRPNQQFSDLVSGVSVPAGVKAYIERVEGKKVFNRHYISEFLEAGGRLVASYENFDITSFDNKRVSANLVDVFGEPKIFENILVLRNPFNMLVSFEKFVNDAAIANNRDEAWIKMTLKRRLNLWKSYAFLTLNSQSVKRGDFTTIIFDHWVADKLYRDSLAAGFGYENKDLFIDFVSDAGKGSSFEGVKLQNASNVLKRHEKMSAVCTAIFQEDLEVFDFVVQIFGLDAIPSDFR